MYKFATMVDYSFIRLKPTLAEALDLGDANISNIFNFGFVQLHPNERYLQITNSDVDIVFNGDYKVEIIDLCQKVLKDITTNVAIFEGTNSETGIKNISFEILSIGQSFYSKPILLKFSSTFGNYCFYSNPFTISDRIEGTTRIEYRDYGVKYGFDYVNFDFYQSIRVKAFYTKPTNETEKSTYLQTSGSKISAETTISLAYNYTIEYINNLWQEALSRLSEHRVIYIDNIRTTTLSFTTDELQGTSNYYSGKILAYRNANDKLNPQFQIFEIFNLVSKSPLGLYSSTTTFIEIAGTFNKPITLGTGYLRLYNKTTGTLVFSFTEASVTVFGNNLTIDITGLITDISEYYITFTSGLFLSPYLETLQISNNTDWVFATQVGDWLNTDWNNNDWLTN